MIVSRATTGLEAEDFGARGQEPYQLRLFRTCLGPGILGFEDFDPSVAPSGGGGVFVVVGGGIPRVAGAGDNPEAACDVPPSAGLLPPPLLLPPLLLLVVCVGKVAGKLCVLPRLPEEGFGRTRLRGLMMGGEDGFLVGTTSKRRCVSRLSGVDLGSVPRIIYWVW